jgi:hypothetical protein
LRKPTSSLGSGRPVPEKPPFKSTVAFPLWFERGCEQSMEEGDEICARMKSSTVGGSLLERVPLEAKTQAWKIVAL